MFSVVFPGQGSQKVGMGKELFNKFELVKKIFKDADEILNLPISKIILEGPEDQLNLTENTQPAIFLTSYAIFNIVQKEFGLNMNKAHFIAGHSLGEYSALCCYGAISFEDTLKTLKRRGKYMQEAIPPNEGSMLAVLGVKLDLIDDIINKNISYRVQSEENISYAEKIDKSDTKISFENSATDIINLIRGLSPNPGAWFTYNDGGNSFRVKILSAEIMPNNGPSGELLDDQLLIACGKKSIKPSLLQREGKKIMSIDAFLRGIKMNKGIILNKE